MRLTIFIVILIFSATNLYGEDDKPCESTEDYQNAHSKIFNELMYFYEECRIAVQKDIFYRAFAECERLNDESRKNNGLINTSCMDVGNFENISEEMFNHCKYLKPTDEEIDILLDFEVEEKNIKECKD